MKEFFPFYHFTPAMILLTAIIVFAARMKSKFILIIQYTYREYKNMTVAVTCEKFEKT